MNANNIISNCIKEHCHNDENNYIDKSIRESVYYCNAEPPDNQSLSLVAQLLSCSTLDYRAQFEKFPKCSTRGTLLYAMGTYDKHSVASFYRVWHIQCTIIVTLIAIALARAIIYFRDNNGVSSEETSFKSKLWLRYILEFTVISLPVIVSVNVANTYVEFIVLIACVILAITIWRTSCWQLAAKREYEFGRRPTLFTLMRSTINFLTALCILAIDFDSFPKKFRKTRRFGVGLMDVGIGLFVLSMGLVTSRPRKLSDLRKLVFTVGCMLVLGLARTLVIRAIDYQQDEHEYGVHLNAFFTLGFTKLFATFCGFVAKNNKWLLGLGMGKFFKFFVSLIP